MEKIYRGHTKYLNLASVPWYFFFEPLGKILNESAVWDERVVMDGTPWYSEALHML